MANVNKHLESYIDQASAAIDKASQSPEFNTMTAMQLAQKANDQMLWVEEEKWGTAAEAGEAMVVYEPQKDTEAEALQERVHLLETKLAAVWDLLKLKEN
jgi:hypothetical protein